MTDALRPQWIKSLRQFRTGVRTLHRLGALERVCDEVYELRSSLHSKNPSVRTPDWGTPYGLTLLSTCIYEGRYTQELLRGFALASPVTLSSGLRRPTAEGVVDAMEFVIKNNRASLKKLFYNIHYSEVKSDG
jgi:hypothetical protein